MSSYLSMDRFRKAARHDRKSVAGQLVRKFQSFEVDASDDTVRFTITTGAVDRDNDRISLDGWDTANFLRAPVVLWAHDMSRPPIGRAVNLIRDAASIKAEVQFIPSDTPEFGHHAAGIKSLCQKGFLFASSVGFRPLEWDFTDDVTRGADDWFPGIDFKRQELMEFSIVSVPANPDALLDDSFLEPLSPPPAVLPTAPELLGAEIARHKRYGQRLVELFAACG